MEAYFVYDCYTYSGAPKAEDAVMTYARDKYEHCLIMEYMLEDIKMELEQYCMKIRTENKRLAPVDIKLDDARYSSFGNRRLYIGKQALILRKVKNVFE